MTPDAHIICRLNENQPVFLVLAPRSCTIESCVLFFTLFSLGTPKFLPDSIFQSQTIDMMYKMIAKAISKKGPAGAKVTDYLNFYSLASKVSYDEGPEVDVNDKDVPLAAKSRRLVN